MTNAAGSPTPAAEALEALLARRCQALLAEASSWVENPDDEALAGVRTLVDLLRLRATLAKDPARIDELLSTLEPALADQVRTALPPLTRAEDSFDDYVDRLVGVIRRFARGGAPPGSLLETARYGHLRARAAGLRTQGDVALWVALQAALGRNFHADGARGSLMAALTALPPGDELFPPELRRELTRALQDAERPSSVDELQALRTAQGQAPPPLRPSWHPPTGPW